MIIRSPLALAAAFLLLSSLDVRAEGALLTTPEEIERFYAERDQRVYGPVAPCTDAADEVVIGRFKGFDNYYTKAGSYEIVHSWKGTLKPGDDLAFYGLHNMSEGMVKEYLKTGVRGLMFNSPPEETHKGSFAVLFANNPQQQKGDNMAFQAVPECPVAIVVGHSPRSVQQLFEEDELSKVNTIITQHLERK